MAYIAQKPCAFAGQGFKIGETVPDALLAPGAAKNLIKMGVLATSDGQTAQKVETVRVEKLAITIPTEDGSQQHEVTAAGVQQIFSVLTATVADAETIIDQISDTAALSVLAASDSRKSIKEAVQKRLTDGGEG
ncbi:MAG: hypothetical protein Q4C56_04030 [Peptococcaceae bacterium]|nr:hypothetical protein [Peptococcaceae bacterium]